MAKKIYSGRLKPIDKIRKSFHIIIFSYNGYRLGNIEKFDYEPFFTIYNDEWKLANENISYKNKELWNIYVELVGALRKIGVYTEHMETIYDTASDQQIQKVYDEFQPKFEELKRKQENPQELDPDEGWHDEYWGCYDVFDKVRGANEAINALIVYYYWTKYLKKNFKSEIARFKECSDEKLESFMVELLKGRKDHVHFADDMMSCCTLYHKSIFYKSLKTMVEKPDVFQTIADKYDILFVVKGEQFSFNKYLSYDTLKSSLKDFTKLYLKIAVGELEIEQYPKPKIDRGEVENCCITEDDLQALAQKIVDKYFYDYNVYIPGFSWSSKVSKNTLGTCHANWSVSAGKGLYGRRPVYSKKSKDALSKGENIISKVVDDPKMNDYYCPTSHIEINKCLKGYDISEVMTHEIIHSVLYNAGRPRAGHGKLFLDLGKVIESRGGCKTGHYSTDESNCHILNLLRFGTYLNDSIERFLKATWDFKSEYELALNKGDKLSYSCLNEYLLRLYEEEAKKQNHLAYNLTWMVLEGKITSDKAIDYYTANKK